MNQDISEGPADMSIQKPVVEIAQPLAWFSADMLSLAESYLAAFDQLDVKRNASLLHPAYFLLTHATELGLKAFLSNKGVGYRSLLGMNHGFSGLHESALKHGLPQVMRLNLLIDHLLDMNAENSLRYPAFKFMSVPDAEECSAVCRSLLDIIAPEIRHGEILARFKLRARHPGCDFNWIGDPAP